MPRHLFPLLAVAALGVPAFIHAQQPPRTELDQLTRPTTVPGFWNAIRAEINLGKFDTAAEYLKGLLALNPTDKDLLALEERYGLSAFLDLNNIPRWSNNADVDREAKENVQKLIAQMTEAVRKLRTDPDRIQRLIRNLAATPEERDYAYLELRKSGTAAMPQLISTIVNADLRDRASIVSILPYLGRDTVPPLLAAFDVPNPSVRIEFLNVLQERKDLLELVSRAYTDPRPVLWRLSAGNDLVATKARALLAAITRTPVAQLPLASQELLKHAEEMYQHRHELGKEPQLTIWKWDGRTLTSAPANVTQMEEYLGLRYARWALELDAKSIPGQVTFLSLALEKAMERAGIDAKLSKAAPEVHRLLAVAPAEVLYAMLDKALRENHLAVALGTTQVIGERAEVHSKYNIEPLVRALTHQDRRLALAAADALIRLPNNLGTTVGQRIVEVYRQALAVPPIAGEGAAVRPRALIADPNELRGRLLTEVIEQAGYDTVLVHNGRDTLRRLNEAADIDAIWVSHEISYPMLRDFLAQARGDYRFGKLPLFVVVAEDGRLAVLPEIELKLEQLEAKTRFWELGGDEVSPEARDAARALEAARGGPPDRPGELQVSDRRRFIIDRSKYPVRVDLHFDALKLNAAETEFLNNWLEDLAKSHPTVRQTRNDRQRILITIANPTATGLAAELRALNAGMEQVVSRRVSESLLILDLPSAEFPEELAQRIARLMRDYQYDLQTGVRSVNLHVTREIPTTITLTSRRVPPPQQVGSPGGPAATSPAATPVQPEPARIRPIWNPQIEEDKIRRAVPAATELRLRNLLVNYRNVELIAEPLTAAEVQAAMNHIQQVAGPTATPLSEAERKEHQRRAIDALRRMATGVLAGYDVRPATAEILAAVRNDDLAPAAIEAAGQMAHKDIQSTFAEVITNPTRPAPIRRQASEELVRHLQRYGPTSITDGQIAGMIKLLDEEKENDVKAGIGLVLGALPQERVLRNFGDPNAREAFQNRLLNYQPALAPAAPMPPAKPDAPKDNGT